LWHAGAYAAMLLGAAAAFLWIRSYGETLVAPARTAAVQPSSAETFVAPPPNALLHVLLALAAVVILGRLLAGVFRAIRQPPVIGEVLAGILLGPSLLGRVAPETAAFILPTSVAPFLGVIAQLGVILYMFLVGLELDADLVRRHARAVVATSHASIVAPFVLGSVLALYLYPRLSTSDVPFTSFALFMGVAMSITAFPVLARILTDRGMQNTQLGTIALSCAAADDVTAWCLLALVVGFAQGRMENVVPVAVLTLGFIAIMYGAVRPAAARLFSKAGSEAPGRDAIAAALAGLLLAALVTEWIGVHAIFGAFLFGAVMPRGIPLTRVLVERLREPVTILLLPAFFAFTGMRTEIALVSGFWSWAICGLVLVVATVGKFGGTLVAARLTGMPWRQAASLGILMNTRGLMELIVLNIGLDLRVISPTLFTMMVLMALVTTLATTPVLELADRSAAVDSAAGAA
jgi:Kef-type K+ transport system membrane component KefB